MSETAPAPHGPLDSRRHYGGEGASLVVGLILIVLGVVFFLQQSGYLALTENWWAAFIYVGAVACFANAWRAYRSSDAFGPQATGSLTWGLVLTVVGSIFWFNLLWDVWWPAILIAVGVGIVAGYGLNVLTERRDDADAG
jgi:hypothetical protein